MLIGKAKIRLSEIWQRMRFVVIFKSNIYGSTAQVIEPIFSKHFEKDPERDFPVLANVHRVARRAKHQSIPKNPLDMEFDMGN